MLNSGDLNTNLHIALLPSAGMGHLTPFLRLAASLVHHQCRVTLITTDTTVALSESRLISRFFSAFPQVTRKQFHVLPLDPTSANSDDPFYLQWEATRRSAHLLAPLLSSMSPPLSALVSDVSLFSSAIPVTTNIGLPNYMLFTASARMCCLVESFRTFVASKTRSDSVQFDDVIKIRGLSSIPISSIPPALVNLNSLFATIFLQDGQAFKSANGVLINTFEALEAEIFPGISDKRNPNVHPPFYPIGPLLPCEFEKIDCCEPVKWLDDQAEGSVVYVSFGSRYALSSEQMKELGNGLVRSGCRFLWVVKGKKVDKEDEESLNKLLGPELMKKIENHGLIIRDWVDQDQILSHRAVGGFISHGGWNSLVEAAWHGVRVLVWPQFGDQKINAEAVEKSGLGMWMKSWGWGIEKVVKEEDIGQAIKHMMGNDLLRVQAKNIRDEARKAVGADGSSKKTLEELIEEWKNNSTIY